jgi:hypothetical protein
VANAARWSRVWIRLKERALGHADPRGAQPVRFRPSDPLLAFLQSL